jgi:hypothetical protein
MGLLYLYLYHDIRILIKPPNNGKVLEEQVDTTNGAPA